MKNSNKIKEIINIGSQSKITNLEILYLVKKITKSSLNYEIVKNRKGDIAHLICSISKAKKILNWKPSNSKIKKIIKDEIMWVKYLIRNNIKRTFKDYL